MTLLRVAFWFALALALPTLALAVFLLAARAGTRADQNGDQQP